MSNPIVSIVVPVFNVEGYLLQCLDSLARQTLSDIEIICLDDGSTDSSPRLLDEYAASDSRFRVFHRENCGVAETRNVGIDLASGDYIMFVDSDDYIAERSCEVLLSIAKENRADIVVFGGKTFPKLRWADDSFACRDKVYHSGIDALMYERGSVPLMCNKMYRAAFIKENGFSFSRDLTLGEDHAFQFICFPYAKTVAFTKEVLYFYRIRCDSAVGSSFDSDAKRLYLHFDVVKYALKAWQERGLLADYEKEAAMWAVILLFDPAKLAYYDDRVRFARMFLNFFEKVFGGRTIGSLGVNDEIRAKYEYLTSPCLDSAKPVLSVFVDCLDESSAVRGVFDGIEFQDEQSLEILFAPPVLHDSAYARLVADFVACDSRARVLPSTNPKDVLTEAQGGFLIRTYANVVYDQRAFSRALRLLYGKAEEAPRVGEDAFDVVTFGDLAHFLSARDFFDFSQPSTTVPVEVDGPHLPSEFGSHLLLFSGVLSANKMFRLPFLRECFEARPCSTWLALQCSALASAKAIVPTVMPLASLRPLPFSGDDGCQIREFVKGVFSDYEEARSMIEEDRLLAGFDASIACALVLFVDLVRDRTARSFLFSSVKDCGRAYLERAVDGDLLTDLEKERCKAILSLSYDDYARSRDSRLLGNIIEENETNLFAFASQVERVAQLGLDIEGVYQSVSYRTGRAVTAFPRKAAQLVKRIIRVAQRKRQGEE